MRPGDSTHGTDLRYLRLRLPWFSFTSPPSPADDVDPFDLCIESTRKRRSGFTWSQVAAFLRHCPPETAAGSTSLFSMIRGNLSAFTLVLMLWKCNAQNSNYNNARLGDEMVAAEAVDSIEDIDTSMAPEMSPIEDVVGRDTGSGNIGDLEEGEEGEEGGMPSMLTPSVALEERGETNDEGVVGADPAEMQGVAPASLSAITSGSVDSDVEFAGGATAVLSDTTDAAIAAGSHHGAAFEAVSEDCVGDGGPVHEKSGLDDVVAGTTAAEVSASILAAEPPDGAVTMGNVGGEDKEQGGFTSDKEAEAVGASANEDQSSGEETEGKAQAVSTEGEGAVGTSGDGGIDDHDDSHEVRGSGSAELDFPAAVAAAAADGASGSRESTNFDAGGGAGTPLAPGVAASSDAENEAQEQSLQPSPPSTLGAAGSVDAPAAADQVNDAAATTTSATTEDNGVEGGIDARSTGGGDGVGGGAAMDDDVAVSRLAGSAAPAGSGPPTTRVRMGGRSSSADTADYDDDPPLHAEGPRNGGDSGGVGDAMKDQGSAVTRMHSSPKKAGRRSEGVQGNDEATSSHRSRGGGSSSSSSSSGWNEAGGHERHRGDVGQGEAGEVGIGGEGASGSDEVGGGNFDVEEFPRRSPEELAQLVREMEAELMRKVLAEEDAKSLLDIWVEKAREYVLTQTVPPTDAECDFSWSRLRCEPKCSCGARLRFGDYTPGRACRLLRPWERSPDLCGEAAGGGGESWDPSDEPAFRRVLAAASGALGRLRRAYEARVAPPTDPECYFSLETRRCEPQPLCRLRLRWGDVSLTSGCRLAAVPQ